MKLPKKAFVTLIVVVSLAIAGVLYKVITSKAGKPDASTTKTNEQPSGPTLRLAVVSPFPEEDQKIYDRFARFLAKRMKKYGIQHGVAKVANSMSQAAMWFRKGQADLYFDRSFRSVKMSLLVGTRPFISHKRWGNEGGKCVVFTRNDTGIETLKDLDRKQIAFSDPTSLLSYLLPKAILTKAGIKLVETHSGQSLQDGETGYEFSNDDESTVFWVLKNRVQAGAVRKADLQRFAGARLTELRVLVPMMSIPSLVVSASATMSLDLMKGVQVTMEGLDETEDGKKALHDFQRTLQFEPFTTETRIAFDQLKDLLPVVEAEIGH